MGELGDASHTFRQYNVDILIGLFIYIRQHFRKKQEHKTLVMDITFIVFFIAKCFYEAFNTHQTNNYFGYFYISILFHLFQGTLRSPFCKIALPFLYCGFLIQYLIIPQKIEKNRDSLLFQLFFLGIALMNDFAIQISEHKLNQNYKSQYEEKIQQLELLSDIIYKLNLGILAYDQDKKLIYRGQYMDFIQGMIEPNQIIENNMDNPNRSEIQNSQSMRLIYHNRNQSSNVEFLDDIKVSEYIINETVNKQTVSIRQIIDNGNQQQEYESIYYKVKLFGQNLEKFKYHLKFTQITHNKQPLFLFTFQLINDISIYSAFKKDYKFRNSLISSLSHKLKTPLNSVITYLENCLSNQFLPKDLIETFIKPCYWNSKILLYLIQDILEYVSIYSQQKPILTIKNIDIHKLLFEIKDLIMTQCSIKGIQFTIKYNNEDINQLQAEKKEICCFIQSDLNKLMRILVNLLNNAYRYTPQGGQIELTVKEIKTASSRMIKFVVQDSGIGLSKQAQDEINKQMQIHQQLTQSSRKQSILQTQSLDRGISYSSMNLKNEVLGISLKITTKLINQLNRACPLIIESSPGQGCKFEFSICDLDLPSASQQQSASRQRKNESMKSNNQIQEFFTIQPDPISNEQVVIQQIRKIDRINPSKEKTVNTISRSFSRQKSKSHKSIPSLCLVQKRSTQNLLSETGNIVIVDDEPFNHITLEMILNNLGYHKIIHCYNGQEAVNLVSQQKCIRTILMDIDMPVMNGIQASQIITDLIDREKIMPLQIIACTAHEDEDTKQLCQDAGIDQIVFKPIFPQVLKDALQIKH
ncbi:unnamed protein product (macronuclear) [Paramecium tetraurelia]|uniref:Response regulatory domain-containing protein n=1 Tax=Paramecium tetraurelia TaxID=5888 RepID=A0CWD9_PARTE|nr:uncharacterized protein GSPATT00001308001 [Paramecium tetraurelia]CAK75106.1 unnamed protein product [Paramecium tetraurelia]|eukprot:XP_001442503.1 hypothetical protein (macronuclear) [Paramecium tetraurelia strain d4-2]